MNATTNSSDAAPKRSPILAALLGTLMPGLGQIYCGQDNKGVLLIGLALFGHWASAGTLSFILCPLMGLDACLAAKNINRGLPVGRWEFFPGIKSLNSLPPRIILLAIVTAIAIILVVRIVRFASE